MAGLCKAILVGNIGRDPEMRVTSGGKNVCTFSVAVSSKKNGQDQTTWYRVTCYDKLADIAIQFGGKGKQVFVEGKLNVSTYTDKNGVEKMSVDIVAGEIQFMGRSDSQEPPKPRAQPEVEEDLPF